jgi:methionyl-tRNA synthetase
MKNKLIENKNPEKIFIGVSWPYASGNIHLGHLAGQYVVCDVFARYHRQKGNNVLMVSGSDCHGAPVAFKAEEEGLEPKQLAQKSHEQITDSYQKLGFLYENYTTTMTENHKEVVQNLFLALKEFGFLKAKKSKQYFDPKVNRFLPDRYVRGTCPECGATNARGDECPECGEYLSPQDLVDPYSTLSDATPVIKETEHFYLDLQKTEETLKTWVSDQDHWRKWVKEFTKGWLKMGLEPRAVTRDFDYGIDVPVKGWDDKVIYVWFEAVIGYLSAAIEWAKLQGDESKWEDFWKNPEAKHYYFLSGGNVPFHTIIWPAELIAYNHKFDNEKLIKKYELPGEQKKQPLNLPYDVPANKMLTYKGKKMSKGDRTGIGLEELIETYDPDTIRYFFIKYAPENHDREYKWKDFIDANNNELVANLGNFINRVLTFTKSKFDNEVPEGELDAEVKNQIEKAFKNTGNHLEKAQFIKAIESLHKLGYFANKYFNEKKPWKTLKTQKDEADNTIYNAIQIISALKTLLKPFLPFSACKLHNMLNLDERYDANDELAKTGSVTRNIDNWNFEKIPSGHKLGEPEILFAKLEYTEDLEEADKEDADEIIISDEPIDADFSQIDPQVLIGKILKISDHPNADRLHIAEVTVNTKNTLQIICGADNLQKGQIVPVATNGAKVLDEKGQLHKITQAKLKGEISEGMLCSPLELGVSKNHEEILILPKSFGEHVGKPVNTVRFVHLHKQKSLDEIPTAYTVLEDIEIKKRRGAKLDNWIKEIEEEVHEKYCQDDLIDDDAVHKAFRKLHSRFGLDDVAGSAEEIIRLLCKKGKLPEINNLVDLYNAFSAKTGISIGAHDIAKLAGLPRLVELEQDTEFRHATTNQKDIAQKGEFAYVDQKGILCRLDIKQGNRTKVTEDSEKVLLLFQGNSELGEKELKESVERFKVLAAKFLSED